MTRKQSPLPLTRMPLSGVRHAMHTESAEPRAQVVEAVAKSADERAWDREQAALDVCDEAWERYRNEYPDGPFGDDV